MEFTNLSIIISLISFMFGFLFNRWLILKIPIYLGATYTNGYIKVVPYKIHNNIIFYYDNDSGIEEEIDRYLFIAQFKVMKELYVEEEENG